jgi:SAM-dependent methyltransferase
MRREPNFVIRFLRKQSFQPGLLGFLFNPFYFIRRDLFVNIRKLAPSLNGRLLDFGCGRKPYENLFNVDEYIGIDMEQTGHEHVNSKVDVFYDGKTIPFPDETFDAVFCSEVFEHVFNLEEILDEIIRVLKKDGQMLITVPFCWPEHEVPFDFGRYSSFGLQHILTKKGLKISVAVKSGNYGRVVWQLKGLFFHTLFNSRSKIFNFVGSMIFIVPINLLALIFLIITPRNKTLYFNNILLVTKAG